MASKRTRKVWKLEVSLIHLEEKRKRVTEELRKRGVVLPENSTHQYTINAAYIELGSKTKCKITDSLRRFFSHYDVILRDFGVDGRVGLSRKSAKRLKKKKKKNQKINYQEYDAKKWEFYESYEWRALRFDVLEKYGRRCMSCGATPRHGVMIHVDHIKPLRDYWHLRLDIDNLQVLCEVCNHGKGNRFETDFRPKEKAA